MKEMLIFYVERLAWLAFLMQAVEHPVGYCVKLASEIMPNPLSTPLQLYGFLRKHGTALNVIGSVVMFLKLGVYVAVFLIDGWKGCLACFLIRVTVMLLADIPSILILRLHHADPRYMIRVFPAFMLVGFVATSFFNGLTLGVVGLFVGIVLGGILWSLNNKCG